MVEHFETTVPGSALNPRTRRIIHEDWCGVLTLLLLELRAIELYRAYPSGPSVGGGAASEVHSPASFHREEPWKRSAVWIGAFVVAGVLLAILPVRWEGTSGLQQWILIGIVATVIVAVYSIGKKT